MCSFSEVSVVGHVIVAAVTHSNMLCPEKKGFSQTENKLKLYAYLNGFNGILCVDCRGLRSGRHLDDDDIVPELAHIHPRERPDWEETISAMVRHMLGHQLMGAFSSLHFHIWGSAWLYWLSWCCTSLINVVWFITHRNVTSETPAHYLSR